MKSLLYDCMDLKLSFAHEEKLDSFISELSTKFLKTLKSAKSSFLCNKIDTSSNISKSMWQIVNIETGKTTGQRLDYTDVIKRQNGDSFESKLELVDAMNVQFLGAAAACGAPPADLRQACAVLRAACAPACSSMTGMGKWRPAGQIRPAE
ncbi:hypothetical protein O0L34_g19205 [Tuta absoluta]|nr:hypothetical protein O0L34_g19205 [Tuta absoluta]